MRRYHIYFKNIILFIVFISLISFAQNFYEVDDEPESADSLSEQEVLQDTKPIKSYLQKDFNTSRALGAVGCVTHFTGSMMMFASFFNRNPTLNWVGFGLDAIGPLPSCIGATLIETVMEEEDPSFPRHNYWARYGSSGVFWGLNLGLNIVGLVIVSNRGFDSPVGPIVFLIASIVTYGAAEVYSGMATVGPLLYTRKAELRIQKRSAFKIKILPNFTTDGGKGVCIVGAF